MIVRRMGDEAACRVPVCRFLGSAWRWLVPDTGGSRIGVVLLAGEIVGSELGLVILMVWLPGAGRCADLSGAGVGPGWILGAWCW
jgi:hypothetical protein